MDYVKPVDVAAAMVNTGRNKLALSPIDLLIRGGLAGGILAAAAANASHAAMLFAASSNGQAGGEPLRTARTKSSHSSRYDPCA